MSRRGAVAKYNKNFDEAEVLRKMGATFDAPDLLAALVQLTAIRDGQAGYNEAFKAALAAIAKARGK